MRSASVMLHDTAIRARVSDPAAAGVLAALAIGDQAAIERDDWDLFRIAGRGAPDER